MDPGIAFVTAGGGEDWTASWLARLDAAIRREIDRLRARYELSLDEFRGLYVSDEQVEELLRAGAGGRQQATGQDPPSLSEPSPLGAFAPLREPTDRLAELGERLGLDPAQLACVFTVLAPEIDLKYATLYAYLNNDAGAKSATIDLLIRLCGVSLAELLPESPLLASGLLVAHPGQAQAAWRATAVSLAPQALEFFASAPAKRPAEPDLEGPARILAGVGPRAIVLEVSSGSEPLRYAEELASSLGLTLLIAQRGAPDLAGLALKASLQTALLYFPEECFQLVSSDEPEVESQRRLGLALGLEVPAVFAVSREAPWRRFFEGRNVERVRLDPPETAERALAWQREIERAGFAADPEAAADLARLYVLHPGQIRRAVAHAARRTTPGGPLEAASLASAARDQGSTALQGLGVKETTVRTWDDLVLAEATRQRLREVESAIRTRETVFEEWAFKRTSMGRTSLRVLFSGASGTGKTLSATIVANAVGLDMYRIDLSAIISKYIGETERNLERVFRSAEGSNAILFFDEADALFGKRSDVKDSHDRYANIEISYLLQRMEQYDGVMILATNLGKNIDEAFSRRIHFNVEFPMPGEADRLRLWELSLPPPAPRGDDVDLGFLARQFPLAGGDIRNVALDAAFLAAGERKPISMRHLVRAMARQRLKQGKLPSPSEFKHHFGLVGASGDPA